MVDRNISLVMVERSDTGNLGLVMVDRLSSMTMIFYMHGAFKCCSRRPKYVKNEPVQHEIAESM